MDLAEIFRLGEREQVGVALHIVRMRREAAAAVVGVRQAVALDHRAHGAVQQKDALSGELLNQGADVVHRRLLNRSLSAAAPFARPFLVGLVANAVTTSK